jgi:hypothetical protein
MTVNGLDDDILLGIFNYFRLEEKDAWNIRLFFFFFFGPIYIPEYKPETKPGRS